MSAQDMRDMLGLTGDVVRQPPLKKQKTTEKRPLEKGIAREVSALMGERGPPISMIQVQPKYKQRPRRSHRAAPWELVGFENQAREDGLVLHHWAKKQAAKPPPTPAAEPDETANVPSAVVEEEEPTKQKDYQFAKYNVQVGVPYYSDELYEAQLQDPDWTKEETDHLMSVVKDYAHKWPIIVDRYEDPSPPSQEGEAPAEGKQRSMEDLKARFYNVTAKTLAQRTPIASMDGKQYSFYQTLTQFNPVQETSRKKLAEMHLYRTQTEVDEEQILLAELQRIMINQQALDNERKEIRDRLDYPIATSNTTGTQYSTSQALGQLFQQLLAADRLKKDRRIKEYAGATPGSAQAGGASARRDSIRGNDMGAQARRPARDSLASAPDTARALSPHSSDRFYVTTHDRISSGVSFASDKLAKPRVAKSSVQTERIAAVLAHLRIPDVIPLPTQRVVDDFDKLMARVAVLLDMRKLAEKDEAEILARTKERGIREGVTVAAATAVKVEDASASGSGVEKVAETAETTRGHKRSASVMSTASHQSNSKRARSRA